MEKRKVMNTAYGLCLMLLMVVMVSCTKDDTFYVEPTNHVVCPIDTVLYKPMQRDSTNN